MAKKSVAAKNISSGNRKLIRKRQEEKRQAKFAAKRESNKAYEYKPIPYAKGTEEYKNEKYERAHKNVHNNITHFAKLTSMFTKLDNELQKKKLNSKNFKNQNVKQGERKNEKRYS